MDYGDVVFHIFQEEARSSTPSSGSGATRRTRRAVSRLLPQSLGSRPPEAPERPAGRRPSLNSLFRTRNRALAREIEALERALDLPSTILILGESGTGKDRLARALHDASRRGRPFVRVDAANLSDDLFESELFGHERGAFTGAVAAKRGLLEVAAEGTAYLDEVSSLSPAAQAKFLRVLQEKTFRRLGGVRRTPSGRASSSPRGGTSRRSCAERFPRRPLLPDRRRFRLSAASGGAPRGHPSARAGVPTRCGARLSAAREAVLAETRRRCCATRGRATSGSSFTSSSARS